MPAPKKPQDRKQKKNVHVIGKGRTKKLISIKFEGKEYKIKERPTVAFLENMPDKTVLENLSDEEVAAKIMPLFLDTQLPSDLAVALRADGDSDDITDIFEVWIEASGINVGELPGSTN